MILVIDNYDSFTYNLVQYLGELGEQLLVKRNDEISVSGVEKLKPKRIVISPGPGCPKDAGVSNAIIRKFGKTTPILGVCLGHQCLVESFGGRIVLAKRIMHGKTSLIHHSQHALFRQLDNPFAATRYHSLIAEQRSLPECFEVTAWTSENEIMGIAHKRYPLLGVQFHPESILTKAGMRLLKNFLKLYA